MASAESFCEDKFTLIVLVYEQWERNMVWSIISFLLGSEKGSSKEIKVDK